MGSVWGYAKCQMTRIIIELIFTFGCHLGYKMDWCLIGLATFKSTDRFAGFESCPLEVIHERILQLRLDGMAEKYGLDLTSMTYYKTLIGE
jgi:hypothetical protein